MGSGGTAAGRVGLRTGLPRGGLRTGVYARAGDAYLDGDSPRAAEECDAAKGESSVRRSASISSCNWRLLTSKDEDIAPLPLPEEVLDPTYPPFDRQTAKPPPHPPPLPATLLGPPCPLAQLPPPASRGRPTAPPTLRLTT